MQQVVRIEEDVFLARQRRRERRRRGDHARPHQLAARRAQAFIQRAQAAEQGVSRLAAGDTKLDTSPVLG